MNESTAETGSPQTTNHNGTKALPAAWREFIRFCGDLRFGEIERLSIQNGVPVLAEVTKKKVKFTGVP